MFEEEPEVADIHKHDTKNDKKRIFWIKILRANLGHDQKLQRP